MGLHRLTMCCRDTSKCLMTLFALFAVAATRQERKIPTSLQSAFKAYVIDHYRHFLLVINLIAVTVYAAYIFADALLIPDMAVASVVVRSTICMLALLNIFLLFRRNVSALMMDMLLPLHVIVACSAWFELLKRSESSNVPGFVYGALIFIVLGNLGVRYSFRGILLCSLLISLVVFYNVAQVCSGNPDAVLVFVLVYLPILLFSLFISWVNVDGVKKAFLSDLADRRQRTELSVLNSRLLELANTDALTNVGNRRAFDQCLEGCWQEMCQYRKVFALLLVDVDYFKLYNDNYGHQEGDRCLKEVASRIVATLRKGQAKVFRYGGEEFVVLLQVDSYAVLYGIAERLREQIAGLDLEHLYRPDGLPYITVSQGAALSNDIEFRQANDLLMRCDQLLYQAKAEGRNRICLSAPWIDECVKGTLRES